MTFTRIVMMVAVLGTISGIILVLLEGFFPQASVLGSAGSLIYFVGGVLIFLAFLKKSRSAKSQSSPELLTEKSEESDLKTNVEDVRTRVRVMKGQRRTSQGNDG
jgi:hypothetical protein